MTEDAPLNDDVVQELKASRKIVGELLPVIEDQKGRVINGRHRLVAGWKSKVVRPVKDDEEYAILRLHFLGAQRMSSMAERAEAISFLCDVLEAKGVTPDRMMAEVLARSPFNKTYSYELVPDRFKKAGGWTQSSHFRTSELPVDDIVEDSSGVRIPRAREPLEPEQHRPILQECPNCKTSLRITRSGILEIAG